jgi:hypothetical protein
MSRIGRTTHTVALMTFVMRKEKGHNFRRAKRMISVRVKLRQRHEINNQIEKILRQVRCYPGGGFEKIGYMCSALLSA